MSADKPGSLADAGLEWMKRAVAAEARVEALTEVLRSAPEPGEGVDAYVRWYDEKRAAALADEPRKDGE